MITPCRGRAGSASRACSALVVAVLIGGAGSARTWAQTPAPAGQPPEPVERVSFDDAVRRAIERNPSTAIAAAGILRAEALLSAARSDARLQVNGSMTTTTVNRSIEFEGTTVSPRNQVTAALDIRMPLFAPAVWARRAQAQDARDIAGLTAADARRQIALATADAYLRVIALRRVIAANELARETAQAHFNLARELEQQGSGSRLNLLRAQQAVSVDEGLVEVARLALYRAQEALGVLLVADGPVDATEEPVFTLPPDDAAGATPAPATEGRLAQTPLPGVTPILFGRTDIRLFSAQVEAAERVVRDSRKEAYPSLDGIFQPQSTYPGQFFVPNNSWRLLLQLSVPIFDSGRRSAFRREREAALNISKATLASAVAQATSEVRAARAAVESAERSLASARAAADEARQVVDITNISFRAGGSTNIEVIDAERRSRDSDTAVAIAEDTLRRARLDLLTAVGHFPQ